MQRNIEILQYVILGLLAITILQFTLATTTIADGQETIESLQYGKVQNSPIKYVHMGNSASGARCYYIIGTGIDCI